MSVALHEEWSEELAAKLDAALLPTRSTRFAAHFAQTEPSMWTDAVIPDRLIQFAVLQHEVILIGVRDHLELWDAQRWQRYLNDHSPRFDAVAENSFQQR